MTELGVAIRHALVHNHGRVAGRLEEHSEGFRFTYATEYLARPDATAISLTMPLRAELYESSKLFPFFCGLLSEGSTRELQARLHRIDESDDFGLLIATGADAIGSVTVEPQE